MDGKKEISPPVDVSNVNERIYHYLKKSIVESTIPAGSRLNIRQLSQELGVSHTPIKDALFRLSGEGLIEISQRSGTYVRSITESDIHEILQVRLFLEKAAIEAIAENITDEQLRHMRTIYAKSISIPVDPQRVETYRIFMEYDSQFHQCIFEFLGNKYLLRTYMNMNVHMQTFRFLAMNQEHGKRPATDLQHQTILEALNERNVKKSIEAVENHILDVDKAWAEIGKKMKTQPPALSS